MTGREGLLGHTVPHGAVRTILALALFVLDHLPLLIKTLLVDRPHKVAHAIRFHPKRQIQGGRRYSLEVVSAIAAGGAILVRRASLFERGKKLTLVIFRALEHQMLKQVGKAALSVRFIFGTDLVPEINRNHRGFVVFVDDHRQAIIQGEPCKRNGHLRQSL